MIERLALGDYLLTFCERIKRELLNKGDAFFEGDGGKEGGVADGFLEDVFAVKDAKEFISAGIFFDPLGEDGLIDAVDLGVAGGFSGERREGVGEKAGDTDHPVRTDAVDFDEAIFFVVDEADLAGFDHKKRLVVVLGGEQGLGGLKGLERGLLNEITDDLEIFDAKQDRMPRISRGRVGDLGFFGRKRMQEVGDGTRIIEGVHGFEGVEAEFKRRRWQGREQSNTQEADGLGSLVDFARKAPRDQLFEALVVREVGE